MDDQVQLTGASYNTGAPSVAAASDATGGSDVAAVALDGGANDPAAAVVTAEGDAEDEGDGQLASVAEGELPQQVAYLPVAKPAAVFGAAEPASDDQAAPPILVAASPASSGASSEVAGAQPEADAGLGPSPTGTYLTSGEMPATPIAPKKKTFLAAFFGASSANAAPAPASQKAASLKQEASAGVVAAVAAKPLISTEKAEPLITLASAAPSPAARAVLDEGSGLPGVRQSALFEIKRKSGIDDDSDVDLHEDEEAPMQLASAAGLARLAPNGLLKQTESVDVACLKPSLLRMLKQVETHYGRKMMITSGYRDPARNRRARGAKNSLHMYCAAVDVQIAGVSKWELAKYVRSMPGRGGVGTYCHTESVHIDVGPERDWNWRCRRRG